MIKQKCTLAYRTFKDATNPDGADLTEACDSTLTNGPVTRGPEDLYG